MTVIHDITMDLLRPGVRPLVCAVQGEACSRVLCFHLNQDGTAFSLPEGVRAAVRFGKSDGTGGIYDTLPDGTAACSVSANTVSVTLAPQVLTCPGPVQLQPELTLEGRLLCGFTVCVLVEADPSAGADKSEDYYNWQQVTVAAVEDYLRNKADFESLVAQSLTVRTAFLGFGEETVQLTCSALLPWAQGEEAPVGSLHYCTSDGVWYQCTARGTTWDCWEPLGENAALEETVRALVQQVDSLEFDLAYFHEVCLPEQKLTDFAQDPAGGSCLVSTLPGDLGLIVGETYQVLFDGVEYPCVCFGTVANADGTLTLSGALLGNPAIFNGTLESTGEPFLISSGTTGTDIRCASGESHTVGIYRVVEKSELPAIGYNDDGKILQVQNGEYVLAELPESEGNGTSEIAIWEETVCDGFAYNEEFGGYVYNINPSPFTLILGESYRVVWDAESYTCVAQSTGDGSLSLGDLTYVGLSGNGEPFIIGWSEYGVSLFSADADASHAVAIYQANAAPELPSVTTEDNGKILQVVDGAWAAVAVADSAVKTYVDDYISSALEGDY